MFIINVELIVVWLTLNIIVLVFLLLTLGSKMPAGSTFLKGAIMQLCSFYQTFCI